LSAVIRVALGLVLLTAAALKLRRPAESRAALATFSVPPRLRPAVWWVVVAAETGLGIAVAAGSTAAAYAAAGLCAAFGVALVAALLRGRGGAPCACFGARSRVSRTAIARALVLAAAFAAVPSLPDGWPARDGWLLLGLAFAFVLILVLGVAVLALAREVGLLRLRLGNEAALEIPEEGPPVGERIGLIERFRPDERARFALAVFSSDGCRLCRTLEPAVAAFGHDPRLAVEVFDEVRDADVWRELEIPGSPFAIALGRDGSVRAKGTFNSYGQLESILATAERRIAEAGA
jgi:Methylamine utilisation protein MauE